MSLFQKKSARLETTELNKRFNLIGRVGQGSMSKVWRAEDYVSGRHCAVKLLDKEKTLRFEKRFKGLDKPTEGDIAVSLRHPNIVQTFEIGHTPDDEMFIFMEYEEGCLSVPGFFEVINRPDSIEVSALNRNGEEINIKADGFLAVVIQHENDHLLGKVFVDYLSGLKRQRIKKQLIKQKRVATK